MSSLDRYTCEQVFHLLDDYVDRELTTEETERVEEHLATCAQCASEARFERGIVDGLKNKIRQIDVPASLLEKIETALKRNQDANGHEEP
ncbi:MAG: zf-HC2 domain-containing protein [Gemmatimonadales bacterium]|jgi:anti-sigma factor (TIGR02949 family)